MEDSQKRKASLQRSVVEAGHADHQADFRVHHVLQLVEVPGGDEQKGLYARALDVTGGRRKV